MTQYIQPGEKIDYINSSENVIKYMDIVAGTNKLFIAAEEIPAGATGAVYAEGVFEMAAKSGEAFTFGQMLYYDSTAGKLTGTASTNAYFGYAAAPKASSGTSVLAKLASCASS